MDPKLTAGDEWPDYYRGYRLQTNADGDVWWQAYQGTERLYLEPSPSSLLEDLHSIKHLGGRIRVTEGGNVVTRVEDGDEYDDVYVGNFHLSGTLVPRDAPEYGIDVRPEGLSAGDLWPSVYDGSKFSFSGDRIWWQHPQTHDRHPVETTLPSDVLGTLRRLKPRGGSFRVTPWNDVLTLVEDPPNPEQAREQLRDLPRVVKNVILLRRERGVEMLPVYVGSIDTGSIEVSEPRSLTDSISAEEEAQLESWAGSLGATSTTNPDDHRASDDSDDLPADDPENW